MKAFVLEHQSYLIRFWYFIGSLFAITANKLSKPSFLHGAALNSFCLNLCKKGGILAAFALLEAANYFGIVDCAIASWFLQVKAFTKIMSI